MNGNATKNYVSRHSSGGGGGGGTTNYNELSNKPKINGVELSGNKTSEELHITGGGGGFNFDNLTLVRENADADDISTEVENGFVVAMYHRYSDGDSYFYFNVVPKELLNLIPNNKDMYYKFAENATYGFEGIKHNDNTYSFRFTKDANGNRMNLYKF